MLGSWIRRLERLIRSRQAYKFFIHDWTRLNDLDLCADVLRTMRWGRNLEPLVFDRPQGRRFLVIAPHPDDETIGPGGTLLKATAAGADVRVIYLTTNTPHDVTRIEASEASRKGGYAIEFLEMPVGAIPVDRQHAELLAGRIQSFNPDKLFLPFLTDDHNDHRRASELLLAASQAGQLPSGIEVWAYQVYGVAPANVMIDISDVADRKAELIRCWHTQMKKRDWAHYALGMNAFNSRYMRERPGSRYGEAFFVLPLDDYLDLCRKYFAEPWKVYHPASYVEGKT